jgi:hypothetical protein
MPLALAIVQLLNAAAPGVAELILLIRKKDGTVAVMPLLDEADSQFSKNIDQASAWLREHGK